MCLFSLIYFVMWEDGGGGDGENNLTAKSKKVK